MKRLDKRDIEDIIALTPLQQGMLFHYLKDPGSDHYFEQLSLEISGEINVQQFERAWNFVIDTNEMLRSVFRWEKLENPIQVILKKFHLVPGYYNLTGKDNSQGKKRAEKIKSADGKKGFDLREVPFRVTLCKTGEDKFVMIISNHHILYDGWSSGIILKEFFHAYHTMGKGDEFLTLLPPIKTKFKEYAKWVLRQVKTRQKKYWTDYLKGMENGSCFPSKIKSYKNNPADAPGGAAYHTVLSPRLTGKLEEFVKKYKVTTASLLYSAWGVLLHRYSDRDDVLFGTTVSGRKVQTKQIKGIEDMVGLFINTLPLRIQYHSHEKTANFLSRINRALQVREDYEMSSLVDIKQYSCINTNDELFDSVLVIENYPLDYRLKKENTQLSVDSFSIVERTHYDLTIGITLADDMAINFYFQVELFDKETIEKLSQHYITIIENLIKNPWQETTNIEMLSPMEKKQVLVDFNTTDADYPQNKAIHQLLETQAIHTPENIAVIGRNQGAGSSKLIPGARFCLACLQVHLTYSKVNEKSNQAAHLLKEKGVKPDDIVGVRLEGSIEMVISILGILKAGGAYLPIDPDYPGERIRFLLADSGAKGLVDVSTASTLVKEVEKLKSWKGKKILLNEGDLTGYACCLHLESPNLTLTSNPGLTADASSLAYVIYTSGSTGQPKGVTIEHGSVVNLLWQLNKIYPFTGAAVYLFKTSYVFDVSVTELFGWFLGGGRLVIPGKNEKKDLGEILDAIDRWGITHINFVPSQFNVFVDRLNLENISKISSLKYIFLAGETLLPELVKKFAGLNRDIQLENLYGPTEAAVYTSRYCLNQWQGAGAIPIGKPLPNVKLYILDKHDRLQAVDVPGELSAAGKGVARGYLNKPGLTAEKFCLRQPGGALFEKTAPVKHPDSPRKNFLLFTSHSPHLPHSPYSPIYKTGDLARWLTDGNIEFLGRLDFQVKIRGFRIELGEIENQLLMHDEVREAVVTAVPDNGGDNFLCAYIVPFSPGPFEISRWRDYLSGKLPAYMVPDYYVKLEEMPLTNTGKINRKALPGPGIIWSEKYAAPRKKTELLLVEIWCQLLPSVKKRIGIDDHFFRLGGHSLKATRLAGQIKKVFDMKITLKEIFENPTIRDLAWHIDSTATAQKNIYSSFKSVEAKKYYPLSSAQERLYVLQQMEEESIAYNMTEVLELEGFFNQVKLGDTFIQLIHRHESLRTCFRLIDQHPVQKIHKDAVFEMEYYDRDNKIRLPADSNIQVGKIIEDFTRPFDLSRAPLLRVGVIKIEEQRHILMVDIHHIISDGLSNDILMKDFMDLYKDKKLPLLRIQYKDFARWQNNYFESREIKRQEKYWLRLFDGEIPVLNLPLDKARPPVQRFEGSIWHFETGKEQTRQLKEIALKEDATLYMVLLVICNIFLSRLSSQEDIVVGTPTAGRRYTDLHPIIGMFVNTLALRNQPQKDKTFARFLKEVRETTLNAFENQDYPFEKLVEQAAVSRDTCRNPLFDVLLVLQDQDAGGLEFDLPGLKISPYEKKMYAAKFDLTLTGFDRDDLLHFTFSYNTNLFKKETIERWAKYFKNTVSSVLEDHDQKLSEIEIILAEEKQQVLFDFNRTNAGYPQEKTIHELFASQAGKTPDKIGLAGTSLYESRETMNYYLSFREIHIKSGGLAHLLRSKGVRPDSIVGILLSPSLEIPLSILAVLSTMAGYLPIDRETPGKRLKFMLSDSRAAALITMRFLAKEPGFEGLEYSVIYIEDYLRSGVELKEKSLAPCPALPLANSLAYVIYTSGTTGKPKGVLLTHRNLVNYVCWFTKTTQLTSSDNALLTSSYTFDLGYTSLYPSLLCGACLHIIPREIYLWAEQLINYVESNRVTYLKVTPSLFSTLLPVPGFSAAAFVHLGLVVMGGEPINVQDLDKAHQLWPLIKFINHYGPTEATIGCTAQYVPVDAPGFQKYKESPTIGKPIDNTRVYILDKSLKPQPHSIPGELCISGLCLARGYLNLPELTVEKFIEKVIDAGDRCRCINKKFLRGESRCFTGAVFSKSTPPGRRRQKIYKTGDLARWLLGGTIEFLGRIDHQVKVRGYRIELGEIENQLLKHHHIKEAVVVTGQDEQGNKYLCAYIVSNDGLLIPGIREYLTNRLPGYMIPLHFMVLEQIPLTPNGKVDRKALSGFDMQGTGQDYTSPGNRVEIKLAGIWAEVLNTGKEFIGIDSDFFQLNGNSLKAAIMMAKIHKEFNVKIPLAEIFKSPTIRCLSRCIKDSDKNKYTSIEPTEKKNFYPLSYNQKRLFFIHQLEPASHAYHMPCLLVLEHQVEEKNLEKILHNILEHHESLRTSFKIVDDEPVQVVAKKAGIPFRSIDISFMEKESKQRERTRIFKKLAETPFDLTRAPIFRSILVKLAENHFELMFNLHHIISDGWSMEILKKDFFLFYEGYRTGHPVASEPLPLHYKDFAAWHNRQLTQPGVKDQGHRFWKEKLKHGLEELALPGIFGSNRESLKGAGYVCVISKRTGEQLKQLARQTGSTLFIVMFSIYLVLLSQLSDQMEVTCSIISAGRKHPSLHHIVGFFVNSIPFKILVDHGERFDDFLQRVKDEVLEIFLHQNYPLEPVFKELKMKYPEIPVSFNMLNLSTACAAKELKSLAPYHIEKTNDVKFDMEAYVMEYKNGIRMTWNYKKSLLKPSFIEYIVGEYLKLADFFTAHCSMTPGAYGQNKKKRRFRRKK